MIAPVGETAAPNGVAGEASTDSLDRSRWVGRAEEMRLGEQPEGADNASDETSDTGTEQGQDGNAAPAGERPRSSRRRRGGRNRRRSSAGVDASAEPKDGTGDEAGSAEGASDPTADPMPAQPHDRQTAHEGPIEAVSKPREHRPERRTREDAVVSQGESARAEPRPDGSSAEASMPSERTAPFVHEAPAGEPTPPIRHEAPASEPTAPIRHEAPANEPTPAIKHEAPASEPTAPPRTPADSSAGAGAHQHASEGVQRETNASADTDNRSTPRSEPDAPSPAAAAASDPSDPKSA